MTYFARLAALSLAAGYLSNLLCGLLLRASSGPLLRRAESQRPRDGAQLLFTARVTPAALAVIIVMLCIVSYVRLEPFGADEKIGSIGLLLAACGLAVAASSILRASRLVYRSNAFKRRCQRECSAIRLGRQSDVLLNEGESPVLGLTGLFRPRLVISRNVLEVLSGRELAVVLRHEGAHRRVFDNWRRLFVLSAPGLLPFGDGFRAIEAGWLRLTEWAADDEASGGNRSRALALASALVRVAGLGRSMDHAPLLTSFAADHDELMNRVERLLEGSTMQPRSRLPWIASTAIGAGAGVVLMSAEALESVHWLLEQLMRQA